MNKLLENAPKGQHHLAQGSALGGRTADSQRPAGATSSMEFKGAALSGRCHHLHMNPQGAALG